MMLKAKPPGILIPGSELKAERNIGNTIDDYEKKIGRRLTRAEILAIIQVAGFNSAPPGIGEFQ